MSVKEHSIPRRSPCRSCYGYWEFPSRWFWCCGFSGLWDFKRERDRLCNACAPFLPIRRRSGEQGLCNLLSAAHPQLTPSYADPGSFAHHAYVLGVLLGATSPSRCRIVTDASLRPLRLQFARELSKWNSNRHSPAVLEAVKFPLPI